MKRIILIIALAIAIPCLGSCGGGGSSDPETPPVDVNTLDGGTNIPVASTFKYTFSPTVVASMVKTTTFFIVPTPVSNSSLSSGKAVIDNTICNVSNALSASVSCADSGVALLTDACILIPASNLSYSTSYTICILGGLSGGPFYSSEGLSWPFEGFMATFVSASSGDSSLAVPSLADIRTALGVNNSLGMVPTLTFGSITMPVCTKTDGSAVDFDVTYSFSGLPSWLSFDANTRGISLASGTTFPTDANTASAVVYTCTDATDLVNTASTESFTINDLDGGGVIDGMEYKFGEVPLVNTNFGLINLTPGNEVEYRTSTAAKIPTGIMKTAVGMDPTDAADDTADFDGDGALNDAEITAGTNPFVALSGANFDNKVTPDPPVGSKPQFGSVADFNGDGDLDFAVANTHAITANLSTVSILLGNGAGAFPSSVTLSGDGLNGANTLTAAEFSGDGIIDLAVANNGTNGNGTTVSIYFGNGDGNFTFNTTINDLPAAPSSVAAGDIDGDGDVDLAVTSSGSSSIITLCINNGSGSFTKSAATLTTGTSPSGTVFADLDNDEDLDILTADAGTAGVGTTVSYFLGDGSGGFGSRQTITISGSNGSGPRSPAVADFNDDGNLDFVVAMRGTASSSGTKIVFFLGNGGGTFGSEGYGTAGLVPFKPITADLDGDGNTDIAVTNIGTGPLPGSTISVFLGNGDGTFQNQVTYPVGTGPEGINAADFDGDGSLDLVVVNTGYGPTFGSTISLLINQ